MFTHYLHKKHQRVCKHLLTIGWADVHKASGLSPGENVYEEGAAPKTDCDCFSCQQLEDAELSSDACH